MGHRPTADGGGGGEMMVSGDRSLYAPAHVVPPPPSSTSGGLQNCSMDWGGGGQWNLGMLCIKTKGEVERVIDDL